MIRLLLAIVAVLACCVPVEATVRGRVRATPFRPFRGPVVVAPRVVVPSRNLARDFHNDVRSRDFDVVHEVAVLDRNGNVRRALVDGRGRVIRFVH